MPTYFDSLPEDVHDSIARYLLSNVKCLSNGNLFLLRDDEHLATLLYYAKNSPAQHRSVMNAMSHCLQANGWRGQTNADWMSTFANTVREIHLVTADAHRALGGTLTCLPQLRKAFIHINYISCIQHAPNLQELTIRIDNSRQVDQFISCIHSLPLKFLNISFVASIDRQHLTRIEAMRLREACPAVEHIIFGGLLRLTDPVWELISGLPALKKVGLVPIYLKQVNRLEPARFQAETLQDSHISRLENMSEIELYQPSSSGVEKFRSIGERITSIFLLKCRAVEVILGLASFPNLRRLSILILRPGDERALSVVIGRVEELSLIWGKPHHDWSDCFDTLRRPHSCRKRPAFHKPDSEVLEEIVSSAKHLKALKFECAILKTEVIEKLLKIAGDKLETLQVPIDWQAEHTAPRMQRILELVAEFCPQLTSLRFFERDYSNQLRIIATDEEKKGCIRALRELIGKNPRFSSVGHVRQIIEDRFSDTVPDHM